MSQQHTLLLPIYLPLLTSLVQLVQLTSYFELVHALTLAQFGVFKLVVETQITGAGTGLHGTAKRANEEPH